MKKKYLMAVLCLAIACMAFFLVTSHLFTGGFDREGLLQDMEHIKTLYSENQALFQEIISAFEEDDSIKMISPTYSGQGEFNLRIEKETLPLSEVSPELYTAVSALWDNGFHFLDFSWGSAGEGSVVRCLVTINKYDISPRDPTETAILLYFCEAQPEKELGSDHCEELSNGCWIMARTRGLV